MIADAGGSAALLFLGCSQQNSDEGGWGVYATANFAFSVISLFSDRPWIKERSWGRRLRSAPFFMEQCC